MPQPINPSRIRPLRASILCKAYLRPEETPSGLVIPGSYRQDKSWSLWEVVRSTTEADEVLGYHLGEGDILKTKVATPVDSGFTDETDGRSLVFVVPDRAMQVIPCTWQQDNGGTDGTD